MLIALAVGLLAFTAVDGKLLYQYKTTVYKGGANGDLNLSKKIEFYIPYGQCSGRIDKKQYCAGETPLAMEMSVLDNEPYTSVDIDMFNYGNVLRAGKCEGLAHVILRVLCPNWTNQLRSGEDCSGPGCTLSVPSCSGPGCKQAASQFCSGASCGRTSQIDWVCSDQGCRPVYRKCSGNGCLQPAHGCTGQGCTG